MITTTQMYWIVTLNSIISAMVVLTLLLAFATVAAFGFAATVGDHWWLPITSSIMLLVSIAGWTFTPSTRQMAAILVVPKIANSEKLQTADSKLYELAVEWMGELKPRKVLPDGK